MHAWFILIILIISIPPTRRGRFRRCSFRDKVLAASRRTLNFNNADTHERLYEDAGRRNLRLEKAVSAAVEAELSECTAAPRCAAAPRRPDGTAERYL